MTCPVVTPVCRAGRLGPAWFLATPYSAQHPVGTKLLAAIQRADDGRTSALKHQWLFEPGAVEFPGAFHSLFPACVTSARMIF